MASSSLSPKKNASDTLVFGLVTTSATGSKYIVASRALAKPYAVEITRKVGNSAAVANDHVILRITRTEANSETSKLVTGNASLDISIPRDATTLTVEYMSEMLTVLASLLLDCAAGEAYADRVNINQLLAGGDL